MKPKYCTNNLIDKCVDCSLTNYGKDCQNNPIKQEKQEKPKILRGYALAESMFNGHTGLQTMRHVFSFIPLELRNSLTGKQLGHVMNAVNTAYHAGKSQVNEDI